MFLLENIPTLSLCVMFSDTVTIDSYQVNNKRGQYFDLAVGLHVVVADSPEVLFPARAFDWPEITEGSMGQWAFTLWGGVNIRVEYRGNDQRQNKEKKTEYDYGMWGCRGGINHISANRAKPDEALRLPKSSESRRRRSQMWRKRRTFQTKSGAAAVSNLKDKGGHWTLESSKLWS